MFFAKTIPKGKEGTGRPEVKGEKEKEKLWKTQKKVFLKPN